MAWPINLSRNYLFERLPGPLFFANPSTSKRRNRCVLTNVAMQHWVTNTVTRSIFIEGTPPSNAHLLRWSLRDTARPVTGQYLLLSVWRSSKHRSSKHRSLAIVIIQFNPFIWRKITIVCRANQSAAGINGSHSYPSCYDERLRSGVFL